MPSVPLHCPPTWQCKVPPCRLVGDPVVDHIEMLRKALSEASLGVADELLLALGAGDEVHQVFGVAVGAAVDRDSLAWIKERVRRLIIVT